MPQSPGSNNPLKDMIDQMFTKGDGTLRPDSSFSALFTKRVVNCKVCSQKNRVDMKKPGTPRCGKCGLPL